MGEDGGAGEDGRAPMTKPRFVVAADIREMVDRAEASLFAADVGLYTRARQLVRIVRDGAGRLKNIGRPAGAPIIVTAPARWLREQIDSAADWVDGDGDAVMAPELVGYTLAERGEWGFLPLEGIVESPTMRRDGSILDTPGYDAETGLLYEPNAVFPPVPENPTLDDARRAVAELLDPFCNFPFAQQHGKSIVLSGILSLIGRAAIPGDVPLHATHACTRGSGKGKIVDTIGTIATGRPFAKSADPGSEDEWRKTLLGLGMEGEPGFLLDNIVGDFGSAAFALALTCGGLYKGRALGQNKVPTAPMRIVWFLTGNNVRYVADLGRRVIVCEIDPEVEHPEDRTGFKYPDLLGHVATERPRLVVAALTVLRAYHLAGWPKHGKPRKGSYEGWDDLVRGALIWAGMPDPLAGDKDFQREGGDGDAENLRVLLHAWHDVFGDGPKTLAEVIEYATYVPASSFQTDSQRKATAASNAERAPLRAALKALDDKSGYLDARTIGNALRLVKGQIRDGLKLVRVTNAAGKPTHAGGVALWHVVKVQP